MKTTISISQHDYRFLLDHLLKNANDDEEAAIIIAGPVISAEHVGLIAKEIVPIPESEFITKGSAFLHIDPDFLAPLVKKCRLNRLGFILAHSHPFSRGLVGFSSIDDKGEADLFPRIQARVEDMPLGAIVVGRDAIAARIWLPGQAKGFLVDLVKVVGPRLTYFPQNQRGQDRFRSEVTEVHERQVRAIGPEGQRLIQGTKVGVIGVGGIGSMVVQMLAHLGVRQLTLVDPDIVASSNRSRMVGTTPEDDGKPKVDVLGRLAKAINPSITLVTLKKSVGSEDVASVLKEQDVLFCCTDNLTSRLIVNRFCHQYFIPVIDAGIDIQPNGDALGTIRAIGGRVMLVQPDGPCLGCLGVLDPIVLAKESDGFIHTYVQGQEVYAPAVISLNGTVASLAVTEFLNLLTGFGEREVPIYFRYDGKHGVVREYLMVPEEPCTVCKEIRGAGDSIKIP